MDHCSEVEVCEVLLFPCVPLAGNAHMVPCLVAWLYRGLTVPVAWHWHSVLCPQDYLCHVLAEGMVKESTRTG